MDAFSIFTEMALLLLLAAVIGTIGIRLTTLISEGR